MKAVVTGGAGFLGSHLADRLIERGYQVTVYDDLSTGIAGNIPKDAEFIEGSLSERSRLESALQGASSVYHFAGHADIKGGTESLGLEDLRTNTVGTHELLAAARRQGVPEVTFASSAVVYGDHPPIPTSENYQTFQMSAHYGASKRYGEDLIHTFSASYAMTGAIFRFVSVIGERYAHGCILDFVRQLRDHPTYLDIRGDGSQRKSFLYVDDCVLGVLMAPRTSGSVSTWNLGHDYTVTVSKVAETVISELGLKGVLINFGQGRSGWVGDSPCVHLDTTKIKRLGWQPSISIEEAIRRTVRYLVKNQTPLQK